MRHAMPVMARSGGGAIVNLSSVAAIRAAGGVGYQATKAAVIALSHEAARSGGSQGIRVNALAPGSVNTDMVRGNPPEFIDAMKASALMGRIADPSEMIGPALLLVSDAGSFITGQTIIADGGMVPR